jgi:hypothetical protein
MDGNYLPCMSSLCEKYNKQLPLRLIRSYRTGLYQTQKNAHSVDFLCSWLLCMPKYIQVMSDLKWFLKSERINLRWTPSHLEPTHITGAVRVQCDVYPFFLHFLSLKFSLCLFSLLSFFQERSTLVRSCCLCVCVLPPNLNFLNSWPICAKFGLDVMPLESTPS